MQTRHGHDMLQHLFPAVLATIIWILWRRRSRGHDDRTRTKAERGTSTAGRAHTRYDDGRAARTSSATIDIRMSERFERYAG